MISDQHGTRFFSSEDTVRAVATLFITNYKFQGQWADHINPVSLIKLILHVFVYIYESRIHIVIQLGIGLKWAVHAVI